MYSLSFGKGFILRYYCGIRGWMWKRKNYGKIFGLSFGKGFHIEILLWYWRLNFQAQINFQLLWFCFVRCEVCCELCFFNLDTRFYGLFYVKNEVSAVNLIYFIFYCGTVSRENWVKLVIFFLFYLAQKMKLADGFMGENWHKIVKPSRSRSGKKMKLTARGYAAAVSFIFFPTDSGRFHNFSQFHPWNHSQFHFWAKKTEKKITSFTQFHVKLATKKIKKWGF